MNKENIHQGSCFCGEVTFTVSGEPELMAYCHCESCRSWSAGPVSAFTLWKPDNFTITGGLDNIAGFDKNPLSEEKNVVSNRVWCKTCGGHLYTDHPAMRLIDVPGVIISDFFFSPAFHVNYQESVHKMKDGLTKYKDLPGEAGGTGITLSE